MWPDSCFNLVNSFAIQYNYFVTKIKVNISPPHVRKIKINIRILTRHVNKNNLFPVHSKHKTITQLKTLSPFQTQHNNTFRLLTRSTASPNLVSSSSRRSSTPSQMLPPTSFLELAKSVGAVASVVSVLKVCFFLLFFISPNFRFQSIDGFG